MKENKNFISRFANATKMVVEFIPYYTECADQHLLIYIDYSDKEKQGFYVDVMKFLDVKCSTDNDYVMMENGKRSTYHYVVNKRQVSIKDIYVMTYDDYLCRFMCFANAPHVDEDTLNKVVEVVSELMNDVAYILSTQIDAESRTLYEA